MKGESGWGDKKILSLYKQSHMIMFIVPTVDIIVMYLVIDGVFLK